MARKPNDKSPAVERESAARRLKRLRLCVIELILSLLLLASSMFWPSPLVIMGGLGGGVLLMLLSWGGFLSVLLPDLRRRGFI